MESVPFPSPRITFNHNGLTQRIINILKTDQISKKKKKENHQILQVIEGFFICV